MKRKPSDEAARGRGNAPGPGASSERKHLRMTESVSQPMPDGDGSGEDLASLKAELQTLGAAQLADLFGCSERTVRRWRRQGDLVAVKLGSKWRYCVQDVRAHLNARRSCGSGADAPGVLAGVRTTGGHDGYFTRKEESSGRVLAREPALENRGHAHEPSGQASPSAKGRDRDEPDRGEGGPSGLRGRGRAGAQLRPGASGSSKRDPKRFR